MANDPSHPSLDVQLIRLLIALYPREFKANFGTDMLQLYRDICRDSDSSPPLARFLTRYGAIADTTTGVVREQAQELVNRLTNKESSMKSSPKGSFIRRHRLSLTVIGSLAGISLGSVIFGFWNYDRPGGYAIRTIQTGQEVMRYDGNWNAGWDDVTANFVADYVGSKYRASGRRDVGYKSPHAASGLEKNTKDTYSSLRPGFDPLLCSTEAPTSVRYVRQTVTRPGYASIVAAYGYNGGAPTNLVQYNLVLDLAKSKHGDWKVYGVDCLSIEAQETKPYTKTYDSTFDRRNDRSF